MAPEERRPVNGLIVRKERKTTGLANSVEGTQNVDPVIFVDDILNSATSAEKARATLSAHDLRIHEVFVVIDYASQSGKRWREDHGIKVENLFFLSDFDLELHRDPKPPAQRYRELWRNPVPGGFAFHVVPKSAPIIGDRLIYRGCDAAKMHAFDTESGKIVWEYEATGSSTRKGIWSTPALHNGRVYFGAYNGVVYCLNSLTGGEIWLQSYGEWVGSSPLVIPGHQLVCIGIEYERPWAQGSMAALDLATGQKRWELLTKKYQHGSPAYWVGGDLVIWGSADHEMLGLDARTGAIRWAFKTGRSVKYAPVVCEERSIVAFASFDKSIYVLDAATGRELGQWETGEICYTTPLIHRGRLYCGSGDRHFYVVDLDTMTLVQRMDVGSRIYSSPIAIGDRVVFGCVGGKVIEVDALTLERKGVLQLPDSITNAVAVSADLRRIYVSTYMNHLYAFERL
jgi:outer membrane protein assembly factor BamB